MNLRAAFQFLGLRGKPQHYGYSLRTFKIDGVGDVKYAQWKHPREDDKLIRTEDVRAYEGIIEPGDFCIDIGAHSGDSTLPMAIAAGPTGTTLALEPNPHVFHVLEKTARANRSITNIIPMLAAATPNEGFMRFEYSDSGYCNGGKHEGISALRHGHPFKLDVFGVNLAREIETDFADVLPDLKFIKTDGEGYDLYILKSLRALIERYRPYVKAEVYKKTSDAYRVELIQFFRELDYTVHRITAEPIERGPELSPKDGSNWKHYDVLCVPPGRAAE